MTILTIKRIADHSNYIYATALELKGSGIKCETDLFVMQESHSGIEICIGECKSEGGIITKEDCDNLNEATKQLSKLNKNTEVYIIFSKTNDYFFPEELD